MPDLDELMEMIASDTTEGWCTTCEEWTHDYCEPDAHHYECPVCGNKTCFGAEELLIRLA